MQNVEFGFQSLHGKWTEFENSRVSSGPQDLTQYKYRGNRHLNMTILPNIFQLSTGFSSTNNSQAMAKWGWSTFSIYKYQEVLAKLSTLDTRWCRAVTITINAAWWLWMRNDYGWGRWNYGIGLKSWACKVPNSKSAGLVWHLNLRTRFHLLRLEILQNKY